MGRSPTRNVPGKRLRVQAQRKFASGTALPLAPLICAAPSPPAAALSPPTISRQKTCNNRHPTEDVLTFLCYKDEAHNLKDFDRFNSFNIMYPRNSMVLPPAAPPDTSLNGIQTRKRGAVMSPDPPSPVKKRAIRRPPDLGAAQKTTAAALGAAEPRKLPPAAGPSTRRSGTRGNSEANGKSSLRSSDSRRSLRQSELEVSPKTNQPSPTTMQTRKRGAVKLPASDIAAPSKQKSPKKFAQPAHATSSVTRSNKSKRRVPPTAPILPAHGSRTRRTLVPSAARLPPYFIPYGVRKQASVTPSRAPNRTMLSVASSTSTNTPPSTPGVTPSLSSPSTPAPSFSENLGLFSPILGNSTSVQIPTTTVNCATTIVQKLSITSPTSAKTPVSTTAKICSVVLAPTPTSYLAESPKAEPSPTSAQTHEPSLRAPTCALTSPVTRALTRAPTLAATPLTNGVNSAVIIDTTSAVISSATSAPTCSTTSTCASNSIAICGTTSTVTSSSTLVAVVTPTYAPKSTATNGPTPDMNCAPIFTVSRTPAIDASHSATSTRIMTSAMIHAPTSVTSHVPTITTASIPTRTLTRTSTSSVTPALTPAEVPAPTNILSSSANDTPTSTNHTPTSANLAPTSANHAPTSAVTRAPAYVANRAPASGATRAPTSAVTRAPISVATRAPTSAATRAPTRISTVTRALTSAPIEAQAQPRQSMRKRFIVVNDPNQKRNMSSDDEPLSKVNKVKMSPPLRYPSFAKKDLEKLLQERIFVNKTVCSKKSCSSETDYTDSDEEPLAKKKTKKKIPNSQRKRLSIPTLLTSRSLLQASKSKLALESLHKTIPGLLPKEAVERGSGSSAEAKAMESVAKKKFTKNISYIEKWIEDSKNASCPLDFPGERPVDHSEALDTRVYEFNSECESQKSYKRKKKIQELKKEIPNGPRHLFYIPLTGSEHVIQGVEVKMDSHDGSQQRTIMRAKLVTNADTERDTMEAAGDVTAHGPGEVKAEPVAHCSKQLPKKRTAESGDNKSDEICTAPNKSVTQVRPLSPIEAPIFRPTQKQFKNPLKYIEGIAESANRFGLCRIIPPSSKGASNECNFSEDMRFTPNYQYVHRMMNRWGPCSRSMCAIRKNLQNQGGSLESIPKLNGIEVDLPKLYIVVEEMGGLEQVLEKKLWLKVAENMGFIVSTPSIGVRLQEVYWRYILPYYTLSEVERESLLNKVDKMWGCRYERIRARVVARGDGEGDGEGDEEEETGSAASADLTEDLEECVTRGSSITLGAFSKLAKHIQCMYFNRQPHPDKAADMFWKYVINREDHVCVSTGSIDSGSMNYGFPSPKDKKSQWAKIPWNLKVLTNNSGNILRSLGPTIGVTVPTVHVGMLFSCCCWCQDPHGLPWIDYHHQGAPKVWYGVPSSHQAQMQAALGRVKPEIVETKKRVWLLSDTIMVPPGQLISDNVAVTRTVQLPGEIVVVSPGAFTSNLCTGFSISENVYFASIPWLQQAPLNFNAIYESREPSMFSFERLVIALAKERSTLPFLNTLLGILEVMVDDEVKGRRALATFGIQGSTKPPMPPSRRRAAQYNQDNEECHRCRKILTMSEVSHTEDKTLYCLKHAAELLKGRPALAKHCKLNFTYSEAQLNILLDSVRSRASASITPNSPHRI